MKKKKIIALLGPTASGKTEIAFKLAQKLKSEVISADSRLVYQGFEIGAAAPEKNKLQEVKHHFVNIFRADQQFTCADFCAQASTIINKLQNEQKIPIVAGGTYLYFKTLFETYSLLKVKPDLNFREKLEQFSSQELHNKLEILDSETALKIHPNNKVKIIRMLEIIEKTGIPFSKQNAKKEKNKDVLWFGLDASSREYIYNRINLRVEKMFAQGLVEETQNLLQQYPKSDILRNTIGYQEIIEFLKNNLTLDEAKEKIKQNTRRYAKRQLSFMRQNKDIVWFEIDKVSNDEIFDRICKISI